MCAPYGAPQGRPLGTGRAAEAACEESRTRETAERRAVPCPWTRQDRGVRCRQVSGPCGAGAGCTGRGPTGSPGGGSLSRAPPPLRVASPAPPCGGVPGALRFSHKSGPNSWERAILHRALLTENENQTGPEINHGAQRLHKGRLCVNRAGRGGQLPAARSAPATAPARGPPGSRGGGQVGAARPAPPAAVPRWLPEHGGWRQGRISVFVCLRPLARDRLQPSAPAGLMEQLAALVLIASPRARPPAAAAATGLPAAGALGRERAARSLARPPRCARLQRGCCSLPGPGGRLSALLAPLQHPHGELHPLQ